MKKPFPPYNLLSLLSVAVVATLLALTPASHVAAQPPATNVPAAETSKSATGATKTIITETKSTKDDDAADADDKDHSFKMEINSGNGDHGESLLSGLENDLIPLTGILATFGTPILIVFFIAYFNFRRRRENLALAREFLNKGLPVPAELLDPSLKTGLDGIKDLRPKSDLRKGFRLAFIGLGITLALYINSPHSTTWGWGLIPLVMGIGFLISGWVEHRSDPQPGGVAKPLPPQNQDRPL